MIENLDCMLRIRAVFCLPFQQYAGRALVTAPGRASLLQAHRPSPAASIQHEGEGGEVYNVDSCEVLALSTK